MHVPQGWFVCQFPSSELSKLVRAPDACVVCHGDSHAELPLRGTGKDVDTIGADRYRVWDAEFTLTFKICAGCQARAAHVGRIAVVVGGLVGAIAFAALYAVLRLSPGGERLFSEELLFAGLFALVVFGLLVGGVAGGFTRYLIVAAGDRVARAVRLTAWPKRRGFGAAFADKGLALAFLRLNQAAIEAADATLGQGVDRRTLVFAESIGGDVRADLGWAPAPTPECPAPPTWTELAAVQLEAWSQDAAAVATAGAVSERRLLDRRCPACGHAATGDEFAGRACPKCDAALPEAAEGGTPLTHEEYAYAGAAIVALLAAPGYCLVGLFVVETWFTLLWTTAVVFFGGFFVGALLGLAAYGLVKRRGRS